MIGIVIVGEIELSPFAKKYTEVFDRLGVDYEIICWNRTDEKKAYAANVHTFNCKIERFDSLSKKAIPYLKFASYAKKIIKQKNYDRLVVLTTQTAFVLFGTLIGKYKKRYYFDYRDTSYEYIKLFSMIVNKICAGAACVAVSSPGFLEYIKAGKNAFIAHNFQHKYYSERSLEAVKKPDGQLVVGYIGVLREYEYLKKLSDIFGADKRFRLDFHGCGDDVDRLAEYCEQYDNVQVHGAYVESEKRAIVDGFDIICYNYPYSFVNYPAIANKLYDGMICKKPMYSNSRTFSGKLIAENGLGISIDQDDPETCNKIYDYYRSFDEARFAKSCEEFLARVIAEEKLYIESIEKFAQGDLDNR